jgi:DNA-binding beta-propeller fold protein YncE
VFNRLDNTPPNASFTEPKRVLGGLLTKLEFNCGLYVDPRSGDLYSVANDTVDTMVIFPRNAQGNVKPMRELNTPHGTFGIAVNEETQELFLTVQHEHAVVVYRKMAEGDDKPLRRLEGPLTGLEDPHGIALDNVNGLMFVSNHGSVNDRQKVGSGRFNPPSITVYAIKAEGNVAPLRVIEGPKTQLNWPAAMAFDPDRQELYVANDAVDSMLVFGANDKGDVAPRRAITGPKTGIKNPTGIFLDTKNKEVWMANMGNHSATVHPMMANGNVAPLRTIRSAPADKLAQAIGNPGAVAYDSKREEILVPN